jgi:hypothetical protein
MWEAVLKALEYINKMQWEPTSEQRHEIAQVNREAGNEFETVNVGTVFGRSNHERKCLDVDGVHKLVVKA